MSPGPDPAARRRWKPSHPRRRADERRHRRRSLATAVALASVLAALTAYTVIGTVDMTRAVRRHSESLTVDVWFGEARNAIAVQEMEVRHYQTEPSTAVRGRKAAAADSAREAFEHIIDLGASRSADDSRRLLADWVAYNERGSRLMDMVADGDPAHITFDRLETTPAYFTLKEHIDSVTLAHHAFAQRQAANLRRDQIHLLLGTSIGYGAGLVLVSIIGWIMLGDQRRLMEHAGESEHRSLHDALTGLPNRAMFHRQLAEARASLQNSPERLFAVVLLDLNGFKAVNDSLGHMAGDQLLVESGRRLSSGVRDGDLVARLGGDEFAVLLPEVKNVAEAQRAAGRLADALRQPFALDSGPVKVSGSFGVAIAPLHGTSDDLIRHADSAMYRAKSAGGGALVYDPTADAQMLAG
jgi:diguanylate cyclase (GGDEF)-like protein